MQKAVRVTLLPRLMQFAIPGTKIPADSVAYQEWIIPEAAYRAIEKAVRIQTYREIETEVGEWFRFEPMGQSIADYIGILRGQLEREDGADERSQTENSA